ncbi:HAD hydrolase, family IIB [Vittaforma corneae ATCC 50505]|uniref:Phosphomannomutase n=1 Tax=Vittaforma corneae (strain ATCC 50505) TaxID=993615 RepID=L2GN41_VITCO|nr:HAD hydrolase, family IIB [Vittaforma corneae ATCC 50505]ELA41920.1 HAD hydrolase, family IIB [Vittaforma corneae ATCC 50505]
MKKREDVIFLFDVDGTLSPSRRTAPSKSIHMLNELRKRVYVAFVGGSDLSKQEEQIGPELLDIFDYGFPENGTLFYKGRERVSAASIITFLGEDNYKILINKVLRILSESDCPIKRGTFVELRQALINVSPIGRTCTQEERDKFNEFDKKSNLRKNICEQLKDTCDKMNMQTSIGGQISIDIFPKGWDKTYCLQHIKQDKIFFFGDMTMEGGNDYEIFTHPKVKGSTVKGPDDTFEKVNEKLRELGIAEIKF